MAKNIKSLQLLRNTSIYSTRADALNALSGGTPPNGTQDGTPVLSRYKGADNKIYTLVGYYATDGTEAAHMTIFDFEGSAADVKELKDMIGTGVTTANTITKQLQDLSGTTDDTSGTTSVAGAKKYTDEKVAEELSKLTATTVAGDSKIVSDVTQANGKITATSKNLTEVKLDGYSEGSSEADITATDSLGTALGKLQHQINQMDKAASAVAGQVVTTVAETGGKVTETKANVKDLQLGGYTKDTAATGDVASTDTINAAISKLENKAAAITIKNDDGSINVTTGTNGTNINVNIKSNEKVIKKDGNGGLYTDIDLVKITTGLPATIKERYQLLASDDSQIGTDIDIYKDSSISKIYLGYSTDTVDEDSGVITSGTTGEAQSLNYVYHKEDGKYEMVHVDVSKFLVESEFASGVTADASGVVHGVVDSTSEKNSGNTASFLTVGANGFKVDGIKQEIINRINELDATVTGGTTAGTASTGHVKVSITETNGKLTALTVKESNIADADDLAALSAKTVTEIVSSNSSISATSTAATDGTVSVDLVTDASKIKMTGFTSTDVLSGISATSSVTEAFKEVDKVITENEQVVSAALNDLETTKVDVITVNGKQSKTPTSGDVVASVTIDGADIKLDGYTSGSSSASVVSTDTVNQAIGKLENQVKAAVAGGLQQVEAGSGITVSAVANNKQTVSANLKAAESGWENPLKFDGNGGLYFDSLDCGEYT